MNKYCKDALYHAWTNTPSEVVSEYNKEYYKKHAQDWVTRKEKRNEANNSILSVGSSMNEAPKITSTGNSAKTENKKFTPDYEYGGQVLYDIVQGAKKTIETGIEFISTLFSNKKQRHIEKGDYDSTIVGVIKSGIKWLKSWMSN